MSKCNRSQVTLFIIIAMMILVMLVIFMISYSSMTKKTFNTGKDKLLDSNKISDQVNTFMTTCLQNSLNEYLFLVGAQGGFIYRNQKGSIINFDIQSAPAPLIVNPDDATAKYFNVTYINNNLPENYVMSGNNYPCLNQTYPNESNYLVKFPANLRGMDCINNFSAYMSNNIGIMTSISYYQRIRNSTLTLDLPLCSKTQIFNNSGNLYPVCKNSTRESINKISIQNQGQEFINYKLEECLEEARNTFLQQINATIKSVQNVESDMVFGEKDTTVTARTHLKLVFAKGQTDLNEQTLYARSDVRIKTIYALLYGNGLLIEKRTNDTFAGFTNARYGTIDNDFHDPGFDINLNSYELMSLYSIYNISIARTYDEYGSLITLIDNESNLFGLPYTYRIREWNRKPMLNAIRKSLQGNYNYYGYVGDYLIFDPQAYDLDDEGAKYNELRYEYRPLDASWKDLRINDFNSSDLYQKGVMDSLNITCLDEKYGITINRCASIFLNKSDLGLHSLEIMVRDKRNSDSQRVFIYVDQQPSLAFTIKHIYSGVALLDPTGRSILSAEDPFIINTTDSYVSIGPFQTDFTWEDTTLPASKITFTNMNANDQKWYMQQFNYPVKWQTSDKVIVHPGYKNYSSYSNLSKFFSEAAIKKGNLADNMNVKATLNSTFKIFYREFNISRRDGYPLNDTTPYTLTGFRLSYLKNGRIEQDKSVVKNILITQCIPYRSDTPSYPFNLLRTSDDDREINPYLSNHTCCSDGTPTAWRVKAKDTVCYNSFEIGTYGDFMLDDNKNISYELFSSVDSKYSSTISYPKLKPNVVPAFDNLNDKYVRVLTGKCDGLRGNVCEPDEYSIKKLPYCGMSNLTAPTKYNLTIGQTFASNPDYYSGGLCTCKNYTLNMTDTSIHPKFGVPTNQLYCCFDKDKLPFKLSDKPCIIPECAKYDNFSNPPRFDKIGDTVFTTSPGPYCKCENIILDTRVPGVNNSYCCNPYRIKFEVQPDTYSCTTTSGTTSSCPQSCIYITSNTSVVSSIGTTKKPTPMPAEWSAISYPNASWINNSRLPRRPKTDIETFTFTKTFNILLMNSSRVTKGVLLITADNTSDITLNGRSVGTSPSGGQQLQGDRYDVRSKLSNGSNTLQIEVTNYPKAGSNYLTNPAGVIFNLEICKSMCNYSSSTPINTTPPNATSIFNLDYASCMANDNVLLAKRNNEYQYCKALSQKDTAVCYAIIDGSSVIDCSNQVIITKAISLKNITICNALSGDYKKLCRGIAGNPAIAETECAAIGDPVRRELCYAVRNNLVTNCSSTICESFFYLLAGVYLDQTTYCNSISDFIGRLTCPAVVNDDPALCNAVKQHRCTANAATISVCYSTDLNWCSNKINPSYTDGLNECVSVPC